MFMVLSVSATIIAHSANITPAQAQLFPEQRPSRDREYYPPRDREYTPPRRDRGRITSPNTVPRGFIIPVEFDEEKILVTPEETVPATLFVAANVRDSRGNTLIPYGSEIEGQIEPSEDEFGSLFIAREIFFPNGNSQPITAQSQVITRTETIEKGANTGDILKGAAIGAGAAAVLSEIFGDIGAIEVLGGAGAGALAGLLLGGNEAELISIDPNNDLDLTLQSDLAVR